MGTMSIVQSRDVRNGGWDWGGFSGTDHRWGPSSSLLRRKMSRKEAEDSLERMWACAYEYLMCTF